MSRTLSRSQMRRLRSSKALPRFPKGDHLFTTTYGEKPISGFSKGKARLDKLMRRSWDTHRQRGSSTTFAEQFARAWLRCESPIW